MKHMNYLFLAGLLAILAGCSDQQSPAEPQPEAAEAEQTEASQQSEAAEKAIADQVAADLKKAQAEMAEKARIAQEALEESEAYLHINAQKPGVQVTKSGLQFEILEQGAGKSPGPTSHVVTHYHATLPNGDTFDSSYERGEPTEFPVNRVITGWAEALQMMKEGDRWRLVMPSSLGYGERGAGDVIPPNSALIFEVELVEVKD